MAVSEKVRNDLHEAGWSLYYSKVQDHDAIEEKYVHYDALDKVGLAKKQRLVAAHNGAQEKGYTLTVRSVPKPEVMVYTWYYNK